MSGATKCRAMQRKALQLSSNGGTQLNSNSAEYKASPVSLVSFHSGIRRYENTSHICTAGNENP